MTISGKVNGFCTHLIMALEEEGMGAGWTVRAAGFLGFRFTPAPDSQVNWNRVMDLARTGMDWEGLDGSISQEGGSVLIILQ